MCRLRFWREVAPFSTPPLPFRVGKSSRAPADIRRLEHLNVASFRKGRAKTLSPVWNRSCLDIVMAIQFVHCRISRADVSIVTDLEGKVIRVICPDYGASGSCRRKESTLGGGPLSQLLERVTEGTLGSRTTRCDVRA